MAIYSRNFDTIFLINVLIDREIFEQMVMNKSIQIPPKMIKNSDKKLLLSLGFSFPSFILKINR
jgi:hypothetical protein